MRYVCLLTLHVHSVNLRLETCYCCSSTLGFTSPMSGSPMALEMPGFMKRRLEAEGGGGGEDSRGGRQQQKQARGSRKEEDQVKELVVVLAELPMTNSAELRELGGIQYTTFLVDSSQPVVKASIEAGVKYNEQVKKIKEAKAAGEGGGGLEELSSPHIAVALAGISALAEDAFLPQEVKGAVKQWWDRCISGKEEEEVAMEVQSWRCRKPQKPSAPHGKKPHPKDYARITYSIRDWHGEAAVAAALKAGGGVRKVGTPPKGTMEREARRLLDKLKKQEKFQ